MVRALAVLLALALAAPLAGCVKVVAAGVPTSIAAPAGWRENATARHAESGKLGLARVELRVWEDPAPGAGYAGRLWVYTLRAPVSPAEESLVPRLRERIEEQAARQGIEVGRPLGEGGRTLASGHGSRWFAYNGSAASGGWLFANDAEVRILGEVHPCPPARTTVVVVGFVQVADARTVGGLVTEPRRDATTWRELAADPQGSIEGLRGPNGLAWNVVCA